MAEIAVTLPPAQLETFAAKLLQGAGVEAHRAEQVAANLIFSNLRGVDSHGVQLLPWYIEQLERNNIDGNQDGRIVRESGAAMLFDAANGLGAVTANAASAHANRMAAEHGLGMVVSPNANHYGAAAYWARRMADAGNIGISVCNASCIVPPWQAKEPRFGTNPICMAVPGDIESAWLLDMATTTVAANRIFKAAINKEPEIPSGWAMDSEGRPTTDTQVAYTGLISPLGGYKGSGLAVMVEILSAILGGGAFSTTVGGLRITDRSMGVSHMFLAIAVDRFQPPEVFAARMEQLVSLIHGAAPAAGFDEVLIAGEPEQRVTAHRKKEGVPVGAGEWERLLAAADRLHVDAPR